MSKNGRVIAVDTDYKLFQNNDFNIGVMLEFSGEADEYFGLTTLKMGSHSKMKQGRFLISLALSNEIENVRGARMKLFSAGIRPKT